MLTVFCTALSAVLITAPARASNSAPSAPAVPVAPSAHGIGAITGIVDGPGGRPLTGACVAASGQGTSALALTTSDGRYTLTGLLAGSYALRYSACAAGGRYADQWHARVGITAGQERELATVTMRSTVPGATGVPPALARLSTASAVPGLSPQVIAASARGQAGGGSGAIAGTVTGGGKPLSNICVFAYGAGHSARTLTSKTGAYRLSKLKAGRYIVIFQGRGFCGKNTGNWLEQAYKNDNGPLFGKPTRVPVKAGKTASGIDAALRLGGEITGTVRSLAGKALSRVCVEAAGRQGRVFIGNFSRSDKRGRYAMHALYPGKYTVVFLPSCGGGNFVPQWWKDSANPKHATKITITRGLTVKGIDGALHPGGVISGVVRGGSAHGPLLKGICVIAEQAKESGPPFFGYFRAVTNSHGAYRLIGLTTGKYRLIYLRDCGNRGNYLQAKRSVSVVVGHVKSGVNTFLPLGAIIKGKVTDTHGNPVRGICVAVTGRGFSGARTAADGTYSAIALPTGTHKVRFSGCGNTGSFAPQYYRDQANAGSANPVTTTAGRTTKGIDAVMQPGGTITGVVTDSSGMRLNKVCVSVQSPADAESGFPYGDNTVTKNGVYTMRNLVPGDYAVNFGCVFGKQLFASQWFRGQSNQGSSDFVSAPAGRIASGVSAVMRAGGSIAGLVTSAGKAVRGVCVQAFPHGGPAPIEFRFGGRATGFTNRSGSYHIDHLAAGQYDIQFGCTGRRFAGQWYKGTASRASTTPVTVVNNTATTGINAVMAAGGSISGTVTTGTDPHSRVCVEADDATDAFFNYALTDKFGRYTIKGLASGSYQVSFFDCGGGRNHVRLGATILSAPVKLVAPHTVTVADEKLSPAGAISGTVLGGQGATPQAGVCLVAVPAGASAAVAVTDTGSAGTYQFRDLAPGTYKIYLGDPSCSDDAVAPQWYKGKSSQATATGVKLVSGGHTAGIDATLGGDGTITGVVTSASHKPVAGECVTATPVDPVPEPLFGAVPHSVIAISAGSYVLTGLVPGKYTVEFSTGCGATGFRTQWWHNAGSAGKATVITVPASGTISGISAMVH